MKLKKILLSLTFVLTLVSGNVASADIGPGYVTKPDVGTGTVQKTDIGPGY